MCSNMGTIFWLSIDVTEDKLPEMILNTERSNGQGVENNR